MLTRVVPVLIRFDSCRARVDSCWFVLDSCLFVLTHVGLVLICVDSCRTRVDLCWHSCIKIDLIVIIMEINTNTNNMQENPLLNGRISLQVVYC